MSSKFKLKIIIITIASVVLFLFSCSSAGEKKKLKISSFEIVFEGPLFEGSNTGQYELKNILDSFLKANITSLDKLQSATLTGATISTTDSNYLDIQSLGLSLSSEKSDMLQLGILNPMPDNGINMKLNIAKTQEKLIDAIKQPSFFIVIDAITKKDIEANISIKCDLEFEIEIKK